MASDLEIFKLDRPSLTLCSCTGISRKLYRFIDLKKDILHLSTEPVEGVLEVWISRTPFPMSTLSLVFATLDMGQLQYPSFI